VGAKGSGTSAPAPNSLVTAFYGKFQTFFVI